MRCCSEASGISDRARLHRVKGGSRGGWEGTDAPHRVAAQACVSGFEASTQQGDVVVRSARAVRDLELQRAPAWTWTSIAPPESRSRRRSESPLS